MQETQRRDHEGARPEAWTPAEDLSPDTVAGTGDPHAAESAAPGMEEPSLNEDIAGLIESGRTYAQAELNFQKTRAALAGKAAGKAALWLLLALVLVNIALITLAVGVMMALAPLITIWGAIGVVVGAILVLVAILVIGAKQRASQISAFFAPSGERP